jgi:hypothetical protein
MSGTISLMRGVRVGEVGWGITLQAERSRVPFPMVSFKLFVDIILVAVLWLWGRLSLNRNQYQELFLGSKGVQCLGLTILPLSCADCIGIWEPQPPGTLRACLILYRDCFTFLCLYCNYMPLWHGQGQILLVSSCLYIHIEAKRILVPLLFRGLKC